MFGKQHSFLPSRRTRYCQYTAARTVSILTVVPFTEAARRRRRGNQDAGGGGGDAGGGFITFPRYCLQRYSDVIVCTAWPLARLADDRFVYLPYYVILCLRSSDASAADVGQWS